MPLEIRELATTETPAGAAVLSRGMRDNPLHLQAFGPRPEVRAAALLRLFRVLLRQYASKGALLGALSEGGLVGVCGMVAPGRCQPTAREKVSLAGALVAGSGLASTARVLRCSLRWSAYDPSQVHWHLGPVGVDRERQGQGVGGAMLRAFCQRMDDAGSMAYLETDKQENVAFYRRFGFGVTAEAAVLGVRNWFMARPAGGVLSPGATW